MVRRTTSLVLDVYLNESQVGTLTKRANGVLEFGYASSWLESLGAFPISQALPLITTPYRGEKVVSFFENLLPENPKTKELLARQLNAASVEAFDLLSQAGQDCAGAFLFLPQGTRPPRLTKIEGSAVDDRNIENILKNLPSHPLGNDGEGEWRISLAGMQEKTALLRYRGKWLKPKGPTPTSHIFKPSLGRFPMESTCRQA